MRKPDALHFGKLWPSRLTLIWGVQQVNVSLGAVGKLSLQLTETESIQTAESGELFTWPNEGVSFRIKLIAPQAVPRDITEQITMSSNGTSDSSSPTAPNMRGAKFLIS